MVRRALRLAAGTASLAAGTWLLRALHGTPAALGADAASIRAVSEQSPNYRDGAFVNLDPASMFTLDREELRLIVWELVARHSASRPAAPIPLASPNIYRGDASRLAVSWFGHSTALLEIDGYRVLTDPVWSDRCSPSDVVGPQRLHPPPVQLAALPAVDAGHQPRPLRPSRYRHRGCAGRHATGPVPCAARGRRPPSVVGCSAGSHC